jgi:hypothetical protein
MSRQSSNRRELVAIHQLLHAFAPVIKENNIKSIWLFSDNSTAVYNLNRKAAAITLYKSLLRLSSLTTTMGVNIVAAHVPSIYNDHADCLSRLELSGDYWIKKHLLFTLLSKWGIHPDVDFFVTSSTTLCKSFDALRNFGGRDGYLGNALLVRTELVPYTGQVECEYSNSYFEKSKEYEEYKNWNTCIRGRLPTPVSVMS